MVSANMQPTSPTKAWPERNSQGVYKVSKGLYISGIEGAFHFTSEIATAAMIFSRACLQGGFHGNSIVAICAGAQEVVTRSGGHPP